MGKDGDQGESSKSQRTTRVSFRSTEASLPRSLCPEMCMICKEKDLKLKHSRQLQSKIVTKTSEKKTLKEAAFARNDSRSFRSVFDSEPFPKTQETLLGLQENRNKSSSAAESKSEETCLGNRDCDSALSLIDNDVLASQ